eukprot:TRINITY_DN8096_c0_g1_i1.p1 TRINITY_DN8096_c0_g1~~TRINITY_DN8096_c0_g1_i1.p1  ORF type:complete len:402 (-),score=128.69 TRINITY_DN8096_c0_g1_i1:769-1974(-)
MESDDGFLSAIQETQKLLQAELAKTYEELEKTRKLLEAESASCQSYKTKSEKTQIALEETQVLLLQTQKKLSAEKDVVAEQKKAHQTLLAQYEELKGRNDKMMMEEEIRQELNEVSDATELIKRLKERIQELEAEIKRRDDQLEVSRQEKGKFDEAVQKVQDEKEEIRMELEIAQRQYQAQCEETNRLLKEIEDEKMNAELTNAVISDLQKQIVEIKKIEKSDEFSMFSNPDTLRAMLEAEIEKDEAGAEGDPVFPSIHIPSTSGELLFSPVKSGSPKYSKSLSSLQEKHERALKQLEQQQQLFEKHVSLLESIQRAQQYNSYPPQMPVAPQQYQPPPPPPTDGSSSEAAADFAPPPPGPPPPGPPPPPPPAAAPPPQKNYHEEGRNSRSFEAEREREDCK